MASKEALVIYITEQMGHQGHIKYKKMFGEYAIYYDDKVVALICDDRLYLKPTVAGRTFIGDVTEAAPYPNAKPCFVIEDQIEDQSWLAALVRITADALPAMKPRKSKQKYI